MALTLILGAPDPEMTAIEELGHQVGAEIRYALSARGTRVRADEAYQTVGITASLHMDRRSMDAPRPPGTVYAVECDGPAIPADAIRIDHHRPGDPGYGRPPAEFLPASSIGQVIAELARIGRLPWPMRSTDYCPTAAGVQYAVADWADDPWEVWIVSGRASSIEEGGAPWAPMPPHIVLTAAADHCLAAAYHGECPGVDPDALMRWRVESRAAFQRRPVEDVLADVERARAVLRAAPTLTLAPGLEARDMRGQHVPELPEASAREGICFVADLPGPDGRVKVVCQSGSPEQIEAFMTVWAPAQGLTDIYGDPARGFAGGYRS